MRSQESEETQRILTLLKLDAKRLFERIRDREPEYMFVFSNKRTREHFRDIFKNRYESVGIPDLKKCSQEVIIGLDNFYTMVDEMRWYLNHTEEMPSTVETKVKGYIRHLNPLYETLNLYINAELGLRDSLTEQEQSDAFESIIDANESVGEFTPSTSDIEFSMPDSVEPDEQEKHDWSDQKDEEDD